MMRTVLAEMESRHSVQITAVTTSVTSDRNRGCQMPVRLLRHPNSHWCEQASRRRREDAVSIAVPRLEWG